MTVKKGAFAGVASVTTITFKDKAALNLKKDSFKGAKSLKMIILQGDSKTAIEKGAFNGLNTKNITIQISSKMSKKNREALKKNLKKAKFQGTIKTK